MVLSCGEAEEGKAETCDSDWRGEVAGKEGDCDVSKPRKSACILRMINWLIKLKAISRQRKMIGTYPLDLATCGLLVAIAREDLVQ